MEQALQIIGALSGFVGFVISSLKFRLGWFITCASCLVTSVWCVITEPQAFGYMMMQIVWAIVCVRGIINWRKIR